MNTGKGGLEPVNIVIFGASGDLTRRKLIPALHSMACEGMLHKNTQIIGVARSKIPDKSFRGKMYDGVTSYSRLNPNICELWQDFENNITYISGNYDDPATYRSIAEKLQENDRQFNTGGSCLFYLSTPPGVYSAIVEQLGKTKLNSHKNGWRRIVVEKPFGDSYESARKLNKIIHNVFREFQIFRIDHYLGKETVQNIMTLRFANAIFEPLWNRNYIDHVQITVSEDIGVEHRAGYYDNAGVLKDIFQNHLMQLLTLIAMEPPAIFEADAMRDEKVKVLRATHRGKNAVRGQYEGYTSEDGVAEDSQTPTYAAIEFFIDNWRWQGVPFFLRSGKNLLGKTTEIAVQFKHVPYYMFPVDESERLSPNYLSICIQPDEGVHMRFITKIPGVGMKTHAADMTFHYADNFAAEELPDAYERLLADVIQGDASLFARSDEIELAWEIIDSIIDSWKGQAAPPIVLYRKKSWGPHEADQMLFDSGRAWYSNCGKHKTKMSKK